MSSTSFVARMAARRKAQLTDHVLSDEAVAVVNAAVEAIADLRKAADEEHELEFGPPPPEALPSVAKAPKEPSVPPPPTLPPIPAPPAAAAAAAADGGDVVEDAAPAAEANANGTEEQEQEPAADADADDAAVAATSTTQEEPKAAEEEEATESADEVLKKSMEKGIKALLKWYRSEDIEVLSGVEGVTMSEDLAGAVVATATIAKFCIDNPVEGVKGPSSVPAEVATTLAEAYAVKEEFRPRWRVWIAHLLDIAEGNTLAKEPAASAAPVAAAAPQQQQQQQQAGVPPPATAPPTMPAPPKEEKLSAGQAISKITALREFPADPMAETRTGVSYRRLRDLNIPQNTFKQLGMWLRVLYAPLQVGSMIRELGLPENKSTREMVTTFMMNPPRTIDFHHFRRYPIRVVTELYAELPTAWNVSTRVILPVCIDPRRRCWAILCTDLEGRPLGMSPVTLQSPVEACRAFMDQQESQPWFNASVSPYVVAPSDFAGCSTRLMTYTVQDMPGNTEEAATQNRIVRRLAGPAVRLVERMQRYRLDQSFADEITPANAAAALRVLAVVLAMDSM